MKEIPIKAAKEISCKYEFPEVIIFGYEPETGAQHVTTYGKTVKQSKDAAKAGNWLKKQLGWPEEECNAVSTKTVDDTDKNFTKEDLKNAYNAGHRNGSVCGMRLVATKNLDNVKSFDEWFDHTKD